MPELFPDRVTRKSTVREAVPRPDENAYRGMIQESSKGVKLSPSEDGRGLGGAATFLVEPVLDFFVQRPGLGADSLAGYRTSRAR